MSQSDDSTGGAKSVVPGEGVLVEKVEVRGHGRKGEGTVASQEKEAPHAVRIPGRQLLILFSQDSMGEDRPARPGKDTSEQSKACT